MPVTPIKSPLTDLLAAKPAASKPTAAPAAGQSYTEIALQVAGFQAQTLGSLLHSAFASPQGDSAGGLESLLTSLNASASAPLAGTAAGQAIAGLSPTGRNNALRAPEAAYQMMSFINAREVAFQAEFAELNRMQSAVGQMRQNAFNLAGIDAGSDNASLKARLQTFADQYNDWVRSFDAEMQEGGALADVQAAQVARHELAQGIGNIFNGASQGVQGLPALGFAIDPVSKLATFDPARLDAQLAGNKAGAVLAVQEFSANFTKSADLLSANGNFFKNRFDNLNRVIAYIGQNKPALQAEFGLGDPAQSSPRTAQSLAAYRLMTGA